MCGFFMRGNGDAQLVGLVLGGITGSLIMYAVGDPATDPTRGRLTTLLVMIGLAAGAYVGKKIADRINPFIPNAVYAQARRLDDSQTELHLRPSRHP